MSLTNRAIKAAKPQKKEHTLWDDNPRGLGLRVTPSGQRSFVVMRRLAGGKLLRRTIGPFPEWSLKEAREEAGALLKKISKGVDPKAEEENAAKAKARRETGNFGKVADDFLKRHVKANGLRSAAGIERQLNVYVRPQWKDKHIDEIRRSDVAALLDKIEDENGPVMADRVLALVRKLFNWFSARDDDFVPPIAKGMARTKPKERARERTLTDDEIRTHWSAWSHSGTFGDLERFLLLTGQRRGEAAGINDAELSTETIDGKPVTVWTIPAARSKSKKAHSIALSPAALAILENRPKIGKAGLYFTTDGSHPFSGFSKAKQDVDKLTKTLDRTTHDLRRTAKTLMRRGGISGDISERVLGHAIAGVEATYDRHHYSHEKHHALLTLATVIDLILQAEPNVVQFNRA